MPRFHIKVFHAICMWLFQFGLVGLNFWIEIFYAAFSSQELTLYEFEKNQLAIILVCHWKYCLFSQFKNQGSIHKKLLLKWEGKNLSFGLCTAGIFTDYTVNTCGVRYPVWSKSLVLLLFLQNTRQEASVQSFCFKS